jgi:hypothetical protein
MLGTLGLPTYGDREPREDGAWPIPEVVSPISSPG